MTKIMLGKIMQTLAQNDRMKVEETCNRIGARIKNARKLKGITHEELHRRSGIAIDTIWRIEKGENTSVSTLVLLLAALDLELDVI